MLERLIDTAKRLSCLNADTTLYCAAHLAALLEEQAGAADGGSGVVTMERIGPKTVEYETQAMDAREAFFATTPYGRMVLTLEARNPKRTLSVVVQ